jgi:hypothetical protein
MGGGVVRNQGGDQPGVGEIHAVNADVGLQVVPAFCPGLLRFVIR